MDVAAPRLTPCGLRVIASFDGSVALYVGMMGTTGNCSARTPCQKVACSYMFRGNDTLTRSACMWNCLGLGNMLLGGRHVGEDGFQRFSSKIANFFC